MSDKRWVTAASDTDFELRVRVREDRVGTDLVTTAFVATFSKIGVPNRSYDMSSNPGEPLRSVISNYIDPKHPNAPPADNGLGAFSADGSSSMIVDGQLWRFVVSPDARYAMWEYFKETRRDYKSLVGRIIYRSYEPSEAERKKFRALAPMIGSSYWTPDNTFHTFRWIASNRVLQMEYIQPRNDNGPTELSYCMIDVGETSSQKNFPCVGKYANGSVRNTPYLNVDEGGFTLGDVRYTMLTSSGRVYYQSADKKTSLTLNDNSLYEAAWAYRQWVDHQQRAQLDSERREREHRQQAELQALYNSVSLLANQAMARNGQTSTVFGEARTDWSAAGAPTPRAYDAGGVYGMTTADGGYYVGNGITSKEVDAFQARERSATSASGAPVTALAKPGPPSPTITGRATSGASTADVATRAKQGETLRFMLTAPIPNRIAHAGRTPSGEDIPQAAMCYSSVFEATKVPGYRHGDASAANRIIDTQKIRFRQMCAIEDAPINGDS